MATSLDYREEMLRQIDHRDRDSFPYRQEVIKPWGTLEKILAWCKSELAQDWRWELKEMSSDRRPGRYIFYFDSDRDCLAFALKWC